MCCYKLTLGSFIFYCFTSSIARALFVLNFFPIYLRQRAPLLPISLKFSPLLRQKWGGGWWWRELGDYQNLNSFWFTNFPFVRWSDGMRRCCRSDWPGLVFCCYQSSCVISQLSWFWSFVFCFESPPPQKLTGAPYPKCMDLEISKIDPSAPAYYSSLVISPNMVRYPHVVLFLICTYVMASPHSHKLWNVELHFLYH